MPRQQQPTLWQDIPQATDGVKALPPASSRADPQPSHDAEKQVTASGKRDGDCAAILALVKQYPGLTAVELCVRQWQPGRKIDRHTFSKRLADLRGRDKVHNGPVRECTENGTAQLTWVPGAAPTCPPAALS